MTYRQAIIWTNGVMLLIGPLGINISEILNEIDAYNFIQENAFKMSSAKMAATLSRGRWIENRAPRRPVFK